jgi:peptidoglycan-associated lipoprotein
MFTTSLNSKGLSILAVLGIAGFSSACSTVSPEEMDTSLQALRSEMMEEMQAGDQAVSDELGGRVDAVERRMAALESDLQEMEQDFQVSIDRLQDQLRFNVPVYFAFDDATVPAEGEEILDRFGSVAKEYYPDALITVEGFTDPSGDPAYNMDLGERRAMAVRGYLIDTSNMTEDEIRAVSYGENTQRLVQPGATGPGTEGWQNRRVVLVIDHDGQPPALEAPISQ